MTLALDSTQDGQTVAPGTTIDWTITVAVSTGDNQGLALVAVDLEQNAGNPELFDLPPGDAGTIDTAMDDFSRPEGISNPGEGGAATGYIGVQRGTSGQMNLRQIGGAQNTFGAAGSTIGLDYNVAGGVGQSGAQTVLSGSFSAPTTEGTYTFSLANGLANVLTAVNTPPDFSPVTAAAVDIATNGSFSFTVQPGYEIGDLNCDGTVNNFDIDAFVLALTSAPDFTAYNTTYPGCDGMLADCDENGTVNNFDIDPFVALLTAP